MFKPFATLFFAGLLCKLALETQVWHNDLKRLTHSSTKFNEGVKEVLNYVKTKLKNWNHVYIKFYHCAGIL